MSWVVGIDIGGTKIEIAAVDENGTIIDRILCYTNVKSGPEAIVSEIITAIKKLQTALKSPCAAVGIGMAGQVDADTGLVHFAPNLYWHDFPLKDSIQKKLHIPIFITNDVRAATFGEWTYGAGKNCQNFVCLFVGTGIGGGIVINNEIVEGASNTAGELGHIIVDLNGPICNCGNRGCLEALAGGHGIATNAAEAIMKNPNAGKMILQIADDSENITAKDVFKAYYEGDPLAKHLVDNVTNALIAGAITIVHAFNPERLILGGGIIRGFPELIDWIRDGVLQFALPAATTNLLIVSAELNESAGSIGAATYALEQLRFEEKKIQK